MLTRAAPGVVAKPVGGGKGDENISRSVEGEAPGASEAEPGAAGQPLALVRGKRGVGGDDDDDRAVLFGHGLGRLFLAGDARGGDVPAHGHAVDEQILTLTVVALNEHAHGVAAELLGEHAGACPDAALEFVEDHAGAAADATFRHRAGGRRIERGVQVLRPHVHPVDVGKPAVPRLAHDREHPVRGTVGLLALGVIADHGVAHDAEAVRVGQGDGRGEQARFLDPVAAGKLAVPVQAEHARIHGVFHDVLGGEHDGDARAGDAFDGARPLLDDSGVPHAHALDVGDGVVFPAGESFDARDVSDSHDSVPCCQLNDQWTCVT